ncbi:manganese peroxidase 1 [Mycena leptocephala]|nr:manganese peroxidase 1 [Mycena leptocephala]
MLLTIGITFFSLFLNGRSASSETCCVWFDVLDDIQQHLFDGGNAAKKHTNPSVLMQLTFHDAIGISPLMTLQGQFGGGVLVYGSIMAHSDIETKYHANTGVDEIIDRQRPFAIAHQVSFGDFIQFAGRGNTSLAAPDGLVQSHLIPPTKLSRVSLMPDSPRTRSSIFSPVTPSLHRIMLIQLSRPSLRFDPGVFDTQFFIETLLIGTAFPGNGSNQGEVESPLPGEFRLQSDFELARDPRTACEWQSFVNNQNLMATKFRAAMSKMAILGQSRFLLTDCSEVIPTPKPVSDSPSLPAGKTLADIQAACSATPFPTLTALPGPETSVACSSIVNVS